MATTKKRARMGKTGNPSVDGQSQTDLEHTERSSLSLDLTALAIQRSLFFVEFAFVLFELLHLHLAFLGENFQQFGLATIANEGIGHNHAGYEVGIRPHRCGSIVDDVECLFRQV